MSARFTRSFVLCLALLSSGCGSNYTPRNVRSLPADKIGILELVNPAHSGVFIQKIDGHRTSARPLRYYELAPGEHALLVLANVAFYASQPQTVYFDVLPGAHYRVEAAASSDDGAWGFGIVDAQTGQRVDRLWSNRTGDHPKAASGRHVYPMRPHY